ncbi:hypothetical protein ABZ883_02970 [Streptomyces sp. NPDC046977]|uniref:hypothetical protein n=1 Tax=Streptomyces sp. NPDC046977 TaxID=3154703 RepID=UPI003409E1F7
MSLGSFLNSVGDGIATGIADVAWAGNVVDRYINPFHVEAGSSQHPVSEQDRGTYNQGAGIYVNNSVVPPVTGAVEAVGSAINWAFSNGVSQPITTAALVGKLARKDDNDPWGFRGPYFQADTWARAWHAANYISPGQSIALNKSEAEAAVASPLEYYKPESAYLPAGFDDLPEDEQQRILQQAGMPAIGNAYIQNMRRESRLFKYASGTVDLALRWYADPVFIAGRGVGAVRQAKYVKARPSTGWSAEDIDKLIEHSTMAKAQRYIYDNRDNPQLLNNLQMARESAMGPRFGAIASLLKTPEEVHDFLRVGMGDVSAIERLQGVNAAAAARIEQDTARLSALDLSRGKYASNPNIQSMVDRHMERLNSQINADEALVQRYGQILEHSDELDKIHLSRWSFARAEQRTEAQNLYASGAARHGGAQRLRLPQGMQRAAVVDGKAQYVNTPLHGGFVKSRVYGAGDFFATPVTVVRSLKEMRPNGYMRVDDIDRDSLTELRGQLARIPGITPQVRQDILNQYLKTASEGERISLLDDVGRLGTAKVAEKHGLGAQAGLEIYKAHLERKQGIADGLKRYSAATRPGPQGTAAEGATLRVDEFVDDGGKLVIHPNTTTRLANDHVFQDLDALDTVLARHTSALRAIRESRLGNPDWIMDGADYITHLFKFATLFRLGYIPRVLGDDVAGQWARLGSAAMAMRVGWGIRNGATNAARMYARPMNAAIEASAREGVKYADGEIANLTAQMRPLKARVEGMKASNARDLEIARQRVDHARQVLRDLPPGARPAQTAAAQKLFDSRVLQLQQAERRAVMPGSVGKNLKYLDMERQVGFLQRYRDLSLKNADDAAEQQTKRIQGNQAVMVGGQRFPAAFEGGEGEMYQTLISPDDSLGHIFSSNKQLVHGHLMRSFDHGGKVISASQDEVLHAESWAHAINNQLMQDPLARLAVQGASEAEMASWIRRTAEGRAWRRRMGLKFVTPEDYASSVYHDVTDYMPLPEIRQAALEGSLTPEFLKNAIPNAAHRPEVHTGQVGLQGQLKYRRALDRVVQSWFNVAANIPAKRMSRHPLFNQLYEGHLKTLAKQRDLQGGWTVSDIDGLTTSARRLALRDTRRLVFDIAHRSDAAAAMRFISPFFSATTEAFQRWGRVIADKPQIVGYAANFFNAPASLGHLQDADGNSIMQDGTVMVKNETGHWVRKLVPKGDRYIVGRAPKWLVDSPVGLAFGMERSSGNFVLSQNSMNIVTQGDPWFHPGVGPIVQIPVNEVVKDKPKQAELARHLGILPFGPQTDGPFGTGPVGRAGTFLAPATVKNFLTSFDTSDERYQRIKLQIMQRAAYEHEELGKPMLTADQIADQTRNYWLFSAGSAFLQPFSTQRKDGYQFYRDQYNALRRQNPLTADDEFLDRYGESYFVFAQAQSQNQSGIPATMKAVELQKQWAGVLSEHPELGALIIGPEGNGPFSPEAYAYQLNHPLVPGGAEMQRSKMTADQAMAENQRRAGWSKYVSKMNGLQAELVNRGLKSFEDAGAEDLRATKRAVTMLYGDPLLPDGSQNPYYNAAWSEDFYSLDARKTDRLVAAMQDVAYSPLAQEKQRTDLRTLQEYLTYRKAVVQLLGARKAAGGAQSLGAKANTDLARVWGQVVDGLVERDTRFGDLYHRYLSRDLGVDVQEEEGSADTAFAA